MELSAEQQHEILQRLVSGEVLTKIGEEMGIHNWDMWKYRQDRPEFDRSVARAEAAGIDSQTDRLAHVYDEYKDPQKARGVSDNIKWLAARRRSDKYGDRLDLNVTERVDVTGALLEARKRSSVPICDQSEQDDTQAIEYWEVPGTGTTGCEPDDPPELDDLLE